MHRRKAFVLISVIASFVITSCTTTIPGAPAVAGGSRNVKVEHNAFLHEKTTGLNDGTYAGLDAQTDIEAAGASGISIEAAVFKAIKNNRALTVQRLEAQIAHTFLDQEKAVFDPVVSGEIQAGKERYEHPDTGSRSVSTGGVDTLKTRLLRLNKLAIIFFIYF